MTDNRSRSNRITMIFFLDCAHERSLKSRQCRVLLNGFLILIFCQVRAHQRDTIVPHQIYARPSCVHWIRNAQSFGHRRTTVDLKRGPFVVEGVVWKYCIHKKVCLLKIFQLYFQKRMRIKKLPTILALHLKRFKYMEQYNRHIKVSHRVVFPLELRLFNTVSPGTLFTCFWEKFVTGSFL